MRLWIGRRGERRGRSCRHLREGFDKIRSLMNIGACFGEAPESRFEHAGI